MALIVLAMAVTTIVVAVVGIAVHGVVVGRTLAADDEWRIVGHWGVASPTIAVHDPSGGTSSGPLAPGGILAESTIHRTPNGAATHVVGLLPADARTVRVTGDDGTVAATRLHRVVTARFYVAVLDGQPDRLRLEALDDRGNVIQEMQLA